MHSGSATAPLDMPLGTISLANIYTAFMSECGKLERLLGKVHKVMKCLAAL